MALKTKQDIEKKQKEILDKAPAGPGFNPNTDTKTSECQDSLTSKRHNVKNQIKRFSIRIDNELYCKWLKYETEQKISGKDISFQKVVENYIRKLLK